MELEKRGEERERELENQKADTLTQMVHEREENLSLRATLDTMTSDLTKCAWSVVCYHGNMIVLCFQSEAGGAEQCRERE